MPTRKPGSQVIPLPYTPVLAADSRPKAARDVRNILSTADVARSAEIVCLGGMLGEAATNDLPFKRTEFAHVKVATL